MSLPGVSCGYSTMCPCKSGQRSCSTRETSHRLSSRTCRLCPTLMITEVLSLIAVVKRGRLHVSLLQSLTDFSIDSTDQTRCWKFGCKAGAPAHGRGGFDLDSVSMLVSKLFVLGERWYAERWITNWAANRAPSSFEVLYLCVDSIGLHKRPARPRRWELWQVCIYILFPFILKPGHH